MVKGGNMTKPKVNEVKWEMIYSKNGLSIYANSQDIYSDFRVKLNGHHAKRFYGETAWMDVTRFAHDQAMEFWDFNIDEIYDRMVDEALKELAK